MADQLNTEEFQRQLEIILDLMKRGIPLSEDQVRALASSTKAQKQYTDEVNAMNASFNKLTRGTKELGQSMLDGKRGMEAMNGGVNAVAGGLELLITLIPGMRLLKIALTAAVGVLAYFTKETNKQADALFKTYQDLSKTGQAAAGGMEEIYKNMQQFGYNIDELGKMSALLKENSQALASFGGTAAAGGKAFANAAEQIQRSDIGKTFQMMGMLPDDINRGMAMYIKSQQAIGIRNTDIN
jgi:methyl-accepting chemotaxis protein